MTLCSICGGAEFRAQKVLWPELISAWGLSPEETAYIDDQQGRSCTGCGASLRIVALGNAIQDAHGTTRILRAFADEPRLAALRVLDLNGAEAISPALALLPGYQRADFPQVDMEALPFADGTFDLVLHSDTLEHVTNPLQALKECRRVLAMRGHLCFTVPVIVGRLTRDRSGLPKSWHGNPALTADDYLVRTEFGADTWTYVMRAGFSRLTIHQVEYPAATAFTAW